MKVSEDNYPVFLEELEKRKAKLKPRWRKQFNKRFGFIHRGNIIGVLYSAEDYLSTMEARYK